MPAGTISNIEGTQVIINTVPCARSRLPAEYLDMQRNSMYRNLGCGSI